MNAVTHQIQLEQESRRTVHNLQVSGPWAVRFPCTLDLPSTKTSLSDELHPCLFVVLVT